MHNGGFYDNNKFDNIDINNDINGTITCRMDTLSLCHSNGMEKSNNISDETRIIIPEINIQIYRYKFTNEFMNEIYMFSKVHQYDHRKVFKEAWDVWIEENNNIVTNEVKRLSELGYDGNIIEKMFKSARYYFRKKSTEKKTLAERRIYVGVQKALLESMDKHIISGIIKTNYKPSEGFDDYCKYHVELLKEQVHILCKNGLTNSNEIKKKIKKTYKNRYFLLIKQHT
jgi:hypothetical protein